jgi:hypothetical protein
MLAVQTDRLVEHRLSSNVRKSLVWLARSDDGVFQTAYNFGIEVGEGKRNCVRH